MKLNLDESTAVALQKVIKTKEVKIAICSEEKAVEFSAIITQYEMAKSGVHIDPWTMVRSEPLISRYEFDLELQQIEENELQPIKEEKVMEKYTFLEALAKILGTKRGIKQDDGLGRKWSQYVEEEEFGTLRTSDAQEWWPSFASQKEKNWIIEPEEIFVWGATDPDGQSWIFSDEPHKELDSQKWVTDDSHEDYFYAGDNVFPEDKAQKLKLVSVDD